ncbi:MAG TPA: hypothetical protein VML96_08850 [Egibacteraceae bacterium]|nr:hypothetical protein [Egibacteraceae bacterium]
MEAAESRSTPGAARPRWPYADAAQKPLLGASLMIVFGSVFPWVNSTFGAIGGLSGAGLWTLYVGFLGVSGSLVRWRRVAAAQAAAMGLVAIGLSGWQLARILQVSTATASWGRLTPGVGLVMVLGGGVWALACARRLIWR